MNSNQLPIISIIMPVMNRGDMIEKAILSVINQNYPKTEFIILDGGSTDNTLDVIKKHEKHITYWHSQHDGSAAHATNMGIEKSTGDIVALLMSDDYYEPGLFHQIAAAYQSHPDVDIYTCAGSMVKDDQTIEKYNAQQLKLNFYNICYGATGICFRFIKKSLHERIGLYIPFDSANHQFLTNDKEFLLRAVFNQTKEKFVDYPGYVHVSHEGSLSFGNHRRTFVQHCKEHMVIAEEYLAKYPMTIGQKMFFRYWYLDQSAKLFLFYLTSGNLKPAGKILKEGIKKHFLLWPFVFCTTSANAVLKRLKMVFIHPR